jgi:DNA-binding protein H-NS
MTDIDLNNLGALSLEALAEYKEKIEKAFFDKQVENKRQTLDQIKTLVDTGGITAQELAAHLGITFGTAESTEKPARKNKGQKIDPKYSDPVTGKTWTGRGMKPKWMKAYLEQGRDAKEFEIK